MFSVEASSSPPRGEPNSPVPWHGRISWQLGITFLLGAGVAVLLALAFAQIALNMFLVRTVINTVERQVNLMVELTADRAEVFARFAPLPGRGLSQPPRSRGPERPRRGRLLSGVRSRTRCPQPDGSVREQIAPSGASFQVPAWLTAERFSGVVFDESGAWVRAYSRSEHNGCQVEVIAQNPVDERTAELISQASEIRIEVARAVRGEARAAGPRRGPPSLPSMAWSNLVGHMPNGMPAAVTGTSWASGEPMRRPLFRVWPDPGATWRQLSQFGQQQRRWFWGLASIAGAFLLVEILAVWLSVRLARRIIRSVNLLTHAAAEIGSGNLRHRVPVKRNDQLGRLGQALNRMAESLGRLMEETRDKQRMEDELRVARQVQESLLPDRLPQLEQTELAAACLPARSVSGDLYDVIELGSGRVGLLCADVSGKGVPAALLMSTVQAVIRSLVAARNGGVPSPAALVQRLNQEVCRYSRPNTFVTLFWAEYDAGRRALRWANAGHCPALLLSGSEEVWLTEGGLPVGMFPSAEYADQERILPAGATLVAYSDGLVEAERPDGEAFGEAGLARVCRAHAGSTADEVVREIVQSVRTWIEGADLNDDLTLVVMRT